MGLDQGDKKFGNIPKSEWGSQGLILLESLFETDLLNYVEKKGKRAP